MKSIKSVVFIVFAFSLLSIVSFAQTREPSKPIRPFVVKTKQSLAELEKSIRSENKVSELVGGAGMELRVAIQHDKKRDSSEAELHDASDDVYYVLEGSAQLTLGGTLENPREASPGEWRATKISGGETFTIRKGDLIIVPRGTPHHRVNTPGKEFSLILIKVYAEPLKPVKP
ncbi:MAG: cupin domain-containing protein [Acidobacteria bacterium]|nr:cupin domain-containing protein [Acidobacteriota bacterium]MBK8148104.1 cupin domain-containing protein [Acidobacteriota bacterium]MBK8811876.1 cupin domain-containing protein [Acidobacteriota bacterium]